MQQKVEDVFLDINTAIPCGLIINELLSNALKHAFPNNKQGKILLKLHKNQIQHHLVVKDNGIGFPKDIDFHNPDSLGIQLVNDLVEQIGGTIHLGRRGGTEFKISF
jgi:two-component sensor histidine kinase